MLLGRGYHRLLYPNFWAEDGRNWYAEAHNAGAISLLFRPYAGYIHVLPRLVASAIAWQAPKAAAISIYVVWMLIQLWLASIIWRRRGVIGVWPAFLIITLTGLAPNSLEIYGNLSNLQWYGAIVLIVLCAVAANGRLRWDEYAAAVLLGLSGPLVLMVAIALATGFVLDRRRRDSGFVAIMTLCSMIVGFSLARVGRGATTTDSTILSYPLVLGYHVAIGGIFGMDAMRRIADRLPFAMLWVLGMLGIAVLIHGLVAATAGVKGFRDSEIPRFRDSEIPREHTLRFTLCSVALMILLAAQLSPVISDSPMKLKDVLTPLAGGRYWFVPALAVKYELATTAWRLAFRPAAWIMALCIVYGMIVDFRIGGYPNEAFIEGVADYRAAPPGRMVVVPIYPPGWTMTIVKR